MSQPLSKTRSSTRPLRGWGSLRRGAGHVNYPRPPVRVLGFPRNKKESGGVRGGKDLVPQPEQKADARCLRCSGRKHPGFAWDTIREKSAVLPFSIESDPLVRE
jgi:hypothetical protein